MCEPEPGDRRITEREMESRRDLAEAAVLPAMFMRYRSQMPRVSESAFVGTGSIIIGDVEIGDLSSIWFGCVIRGDVNHVRIGSETNIQDMTMIHCSGIGSLHPTIIGDRVTVGHMVLLHGCRLENDCMVGMRAVIMDGAVIESGAMVAAGALIAPGARVPGGELWAGVPASKLRNLSQSSVDMHSKLTGSYVKLSREYLGQ